MIKLFNDPVHGFIEVPTGLILQLVNHPYVQRMRRIRQLGLTSLVYPGAVHSRFSHVLGAMYLMQQALNTLRSKGVEITDLEYEQAQVAILLHDIGHAPFSHALEFVLLDGYHHETIGRAVMERLNAELEGRISTALQIFEGSYPKPFLHQLVSGQLDTDRLDYLMRDSFFTGVQEGIVGTDRILKTLNVFDGQLVVEEKGVYSIEKLIIARRLMYWQVYLHKTVMSAEQLLIRLLTRAKALFAAGEALWLDERLTYFFRQTPTETLTEETLARYMALDDEDILYAIKRWQACGDRLLAELSTRLLQRKLLKLRYYDHPVPVGELHARLTHHQQSLGYGPEEMSYLVFDGSTSNLAYGLGRTDEPIRILGKDGRVRDLTEATDLPNFRDLTHPITRYYLCQPGY
jgi:HD superfamily phosphohydrolase